MVCEKHNCGAARAHSLPMAKKQTPPDEQEQGSESLLVSAAKGLGAAAGKIASIAGAKTDAPAEGAKPKSPPKPKAEKLAPKNKARLPRKQKKAQRVASARKA